ncbi:hypothetical protein AMJ86_05940, partial [bacterium SM23_57]
MALFRGFRRHLRFPLIRIDDRLIHGQIVLGWAEPLHIRRLVLAHDGIAQDDNLREAIAATVPTQFDFSVLTIEDTIAAVNDHKLSKRLMVVTESPGSVMAMWEQGAGINSINIGGLHYRDDRIELLPYVFLSPGELNQITELVKSGVDVYCQDLPNSPLSPWNKLLEKL